MSLSLSLEVADGTELMEVMNAWSKLPGAVKMGILATVRATPER